MSTTVTEIEALADRYGEAWNRQDLEPALMADVHPIPAEREALT